jgi:hypothetical protein
MKNNKINALFQSELKVINVGLKEFYDNLKKEGCSALHVDWRPPARGNKKMLSVLDRLKKFA